MRPPLCALALAAVLLCGCASSNRQSEATPPPKPPTVAEAGKIVAGHHQREVVQFHAAERINVSVTGLSVEAEVRAQTTVIVDANKQASAQQIDDMAAAFLRATAAFEAQRIADAATIADLRKEIDELKNQALREQAQWLTWTGVGLFAAFGVSLIIGHLAAAAKTWPLALLGAGCFGLAQLISHPWFLRGFVGLLVAGVAYSAYYVFDRHREGRLRRSLEKKADVLKQIVPVLDDAYDSAADSVKQALDANVFDRLSAVFDRDQKATVHAVRAEVKAT